MSDISESTLVTCDRKNHIIHINYGLRSKVLSISTGSISLASKLFLYYSKTTTALRIMSIHKHETLTSMRFWYLAKDRDHLTNTNATNLSYHTNIQSFLKLTANVARKGNDTLQNKKTLILNLHSNNVTIPCTCMGILLQQIWVDSFTDQAYK